MRAVTMFRSRWIKGEIVGIVGESDSHGKSVTSLSIMRLILILRVDCGWKNQLLRDGKTPIDLVQIPDNEMRSYRGNEISMIFQEPMTSLNPITPAVIGWWKPSYLHQKVTKKEAEKRWSSLRRNETAESENSHRLSHQLSGGQKQRVMITISMSCQPNTNCRWTDYRIGCNGAKTILRTDPMIWAGNRDVHNLHHHDLGVIAEITGQSGRNV